MSSLARFGAIATGALMLTSTAFADEMWLPPQKKQCTLVPGADCGLDVKCPSDKPYAMSGGGGLPKVSDANHRVAMTMNAAISSNAWRVRWRNMGDTKVDATVMIRVLCSGDGDAWGK